MEKFSKIPRLTWSTFSLPLAAATDTGRLPALVTEQPVETVEI